MIKARDISKLPVWAQHELTRLAEDVQYWKKLALRVEAGESNVQYSQGFMDDWQGLPDHCIVRFKIGKKDTIDCHIERDNPDVVSVSAGVKRLIVEPVVSNVVHLRSVEY